MSELRQLNVALSIVSTNVTIRYHHYHKCARLVYWVIGGDKKMFGKRKMQI